MLLPIKSQYIEILSKSTSLYTKDLAKLFAISYSHNDLLSNLQLSSSPAGKYFAFAVKSDEGEKYGLAFITTIDEYQIAFVWLPSYGENTEQLDFGSLLSEYSLNTIILIADENYSIGQDVVGNWFPGGHISYTHGYAEKNIRYTDKADVAQTKESFPPNIGSILTNKFHYFNLSTSYAPLSGVAGVGVLELSSPSYTLYSISNDWESIRNFLMTRSALHTYKIFHKYPFNYPSETPIERVNIYTHSTIKWVFEPMKAGVQVAPGGS